jgi:hypothetical protein
MSLFDDLETRKEKVEELLTKKGKGNQKARVIVALDYSGSMSHLYADGTVQTLVERLLPIGMAMDDDKSIEFYTFENHFVKRPDVTQSNIKNYVQKNIDGYMGGTSYAPVLREIAANMGISLSGYKSTSPSPKKGGFFSRLLGGQTETATAEQTVAQGQPFPFPGYVIFITDGETSGHSEIEAVIREMSNYGVFIQFVGIGHESFQFLDRLDNLSGRKIDNANFFKIKDLSTVSDDKLYDLLLTEFPSWINLAKQHKLIQ